MNDNLTKSNVGFERSKLLRTKLNWKFMKLNEEVTKMGGKPIFARNKMSGTWLPRGSYGIYMIIKGSIGTSTGSRVRIHPVAATYIRQLPPRPRNCHEIATSHSISRKSPCMALTGRLYVKV